MGKTALAMLFALFALAFAGYLAFAEKTDARADAGRAEAEPEKFWENPVFREALAGSGKRGIKGITIVAPASGLGEESAEKARGIAASLGVRFPAEAMRYGVVPYNANSDEVRLEQFKLAVNDPETEVLWAVRGGYGSVRLLEALAEMPKPDRPKIFVGYSDMTFLHLLLRRWGWRTVHGAMFWELSFAGAGKSEENFHRLASVLSGREKELRYEGLKPFNKAAEEAAAVIEGVLTGGNLTCLAAAAGTPWPVAMEGGIVFIEDVQEPGYKIDRMLTQLRLAGDLDGMRAVVLGEFTLGDDATEFALKRFADAFDQPVFRTNLFGHGKKNYPLIFNSPTVIEKAPDGSGSHILRMEAGALP